MTEASDLELIARRRAEDQRRFLISALNDENAPRLAPAANAMRDLLRGGEWQSWAAVMAAALRGSDLAVKSVDNFLRQLLTAGFVERRGEYERRYNRAARRWQHGDTREVRLIDWPESIDG